VVLEGIAIGVSLASLLISGLTAWATLRRGTIKMTRPTVIYFGPDGGARGVNKVFLRTILYSTGARGRIIEEMFLKLHRGESSQTFNIWVYGDDSLLRGSGLKIGPEGLTCNHHFILREAGPDYDFLPGDYRLEVFASIVGSRRPQRLHACELNLTPDQATAIKNKTEGVYFDWGPNSQSYHASARPHGKRLSPHGPEDAVPDIAELHIRFKES
jgi:hypothetical protein